MLLSFPGKKTSEIAIGEPWNVFASMGWYCRDFTSAKPQKHRTKEAAAEPPAIMVIGALAAGAFYDSSWKDLLLKTFERGTSLWKPQRNYRCEWENHHHLVVPVLDHSAVQRQVPGSGAVPNLARYDHQERTATYSGGGATKILGHKKGPNSGVQKLIL